MSEVRRSTRIRDKSSKDDEEREQTDSMGLIHADEDIDIGTGSEDETDNNHAHRSVDDEDYQEPKAKKRKREQSDKPQGRETQHRSKRTRTPYSNLSKYSKKNSDAFLQMQQGFEPTELFQIMAHSEDYSIEELSNSWLESYSANRTQALQEFINFLLNCCGSLIQVQEHDVASNETANETVGEIQLLFQNQELHESYLLLSKTNKRRARYKPLYHNFTEFMHKLIEVANERGLLYEESVGSDSAGNENSSLILDLLTWLSSLSVSKIRCLRHVATLCMYSFQDYLTELSVDLENNYLVKLRRQLSMEEKKKRANPKTAEKLESTIVEIQESKSVVENSIDNIIKLAFVHRFKDVDEAIRADSMVHLAIWLENYPEYFMKVTFLKYFGWLLSDLSSTVRLQVLKVLLEVLKFDSKRSKHKVGNSAIRQFFERFKQRILEMCLKDIDMQVRITAIQVLTQVNSFGYLEDNEISKVSSLIFNYQRINTTSAARNAKLLSSVAKFFASVQKDKMDLVLESYTFPTKSKVLKSHDIVEVGFFMKTLIKSMSSYLSDLNDECTVQERTHLIFQAAEFLEPYFGNLIVSMCELLSFDGSLDGFADVEEEDNNGEKLLLLPTDENSTAQYVVVLSGLCNGGANEKNSKKAENTTRVLPHLAKLFTTLPLHSGVVMRYLFSIYTLFTFEEWVAAHLEPQFQKITDSIVKIFDRLQFTNDRDDIKRSSFAKLLQYHKNLGLPQINELWKNQVGQLRISLQIFLETKTDDFSESESDELFTNVFEMYVNKLVLLGKIVPLDITSDFLQLFFVKIVDKLPHVLNSLQKETIKEIDFRFITLVVTWNLQQWFNILQNSTDASPLSRSVLETVTNVINQLTHNLSIMGSCQTNELQTRLHINWKFCDTLCDCLTAFKMFELNIPDRDYDWQQAMVQTYAINVGSKLTQSFLDVFLYLEGLRAKELGVYLDRSEDEDVNLNSISDDTIDNVEQELIVYVVKLKGLMNLGLLDASGIESRIAMNKDVLGEEFVSVVDDTAFGSQSAPKRQLASANHEHQVFDQSIQSDQESDLGQEPSAHNDRPSLNASATILEEAEPREPSSQYL
ncbi:LANO_0F10616g1_1 [Lachancea nothofagi CBS 11611]|uniref:LANO_0F10616g1_1 n=1 Tax=Lachancea nothofagi CBS 11611 TaxID=1266666 RepID=A0A1G4KAH2_9SACH|nr:LANO_0F10616g1_1 [Lachancea nothofagi CBS 11611]